MLHLLDHLGVPAATWSPDGQLLAITSSTNALGVYKFSGTSLQLLTITAPFAGSGPLNVSWSADGNYLAVTSGSAGPATLTILKFNETSLTTQFTAPLTGGGSFAFNQGLQWSPTGNVLALGSLNVEYIYAGFNFPSGTLIQNNKLSNIRGPALPAGQPGVSSGRGLSASSATNLIVHNTAFDNDLNYVFVNNIFEQFVANAALNQVYFQIYHFHPCKELDKALEMF